MSNSLNTSLSDGKQQAPLKAVLSQKLGLTGSITAMNFYDYYTKDEIHELFSTIVTLKRDSYFNFPNVGHEGTMYVDISTGSTYVWDNESMSYWCIGRDYEKIQQINGGNANE